jgi:site-specific DNA-methyltransferase (adenine-specific)
VIRLLLGDCVARMGEMPDACLDAVVVDPPYGLEFMGKSWDNLTGPTRTWESGGGFGKAHIGLTPLPSYSATRQFGAANPTCAVCGGRLRGAKKCSCDQPHDHWKPIGKRRKLPDDTPDGVTGGGMGDHLKAMQEWHATWLREAFRVIAPGGAIKVFSGSRTFHRLAAAMDEVGFGPLRLDAWIYASGFPKSLSMGKAIDRMLGAERQVIGRAKGRGSNAGSDCYNWNNPNDKVDRTIYDVTVPATEEAATWEGWGTALKPAWEPILVGLKPPPMA